MCQNTKYMYYYFCILYYFCTLCFVHMYIVFCYTCTLFFDFCKAHYKSRPTTNRQRSTLDTPCKAFFAYTGLFCTKEPFDCTGLFCAKEPLAYAGLFCAKELSTNRQRSTLDTPCKALLAYTGLFCAKELYASVTEPSRFTYI